jgi:TCP-1/cpn60 chaperonin family.
MKKHVLYRAIILPSVNISKYTSKQFIDLIYICQKTKHFNQFFPFLFLFKAKHAEGGNHTWGINGETGELADMNDIGVWDCYSVKAQTYKTALEVSSFYFATFLSICLCVSLIFMPSVKNLPLITHWLVENFLITTKIECTDHLKSFPNSQRDICFQDSLQHTVSCLIIIPILFCSIDCYVIASYWRYCIRNKESNRWSKRTFRWTAATDGYRIERRFSTNWFLQCSPFLFDH